MPYKRHIRLINLILVRASLRLNLNLNSERKISRGNIKTNSRAKAVGERLRWVPISINTKLNHIKKPLRTK